MEGQSEEAKGQAAEQADEVEKQVAVVEAREEEPRPGPYTRSMGRCYLPLPKTTHIDFYSLCLKNMIRSGHCFCPSYNQSFDFYVYNLIQAEF